MKNRLHRIKNQKGFTLIELVVVCVILSILMAITVPAGMKYIEKKKADQCEAKRSALIYGLETALLDGETPEEYWNSISDEDMTCPSGKRYYLNAAKNEIFCEEPDHKESHFTILADAGEGIPPVDPANPGDIDDGGGSGGGSGGTDPEPGTKDDADEDFKKFAGDFEGLWNYAMGLKSGDYVGEWSRYTVFRDKNGDYIMMLNTKLPLEYFNENHDKIQGMSQGKNAEYVVLDLDNIVNYEKDEVKNNYSAGTVAYYQGKYYAAKEKTFGAKPGSYPWVEIKDQGPWTPGK
ncbi:MAG: competence type IV pilus major pilin ComGC [Blautia sp.]